MENNELYLDGYEDALLELEAYINERIKAHGGARTTTSILRVFNDTISYLEDKKDFVMSRHVQPQDLHDVLSTLFPFGDTPLSSDKVVHILFTSK